MDLRISVPNNEETISLIGFFLQGETLNITFFAQRPGQSGSIVVCFHSEEATLLRVGMPYVLQSFNAEYGGTIVFGDRIKEETPICWSGDLPVSEECLIRYIPSCITAVRQTCDNTVLVGEVHLSGENRDICEIGMTQTGSYFPAVGDIPAITLKLQDTGAFNNENPMVNMANGVNSYFDVSPPVSRLFGATPDSSGNIRIHFDEHFLFTPVAGTGSVLAVGTDMTVAEVCEEITAADQAGDEPGAGSDDDVSETCRVSDIQFEVVPYVG